MTHLDRTKSHDTPSSAPPPAAGGEIGAVVRGVADPGDVYAALLVRPS